MLSSMTVNAQVNVSAKIENDKFHNPGKTNIVIRIKNENDTQIDNVRLKTDGISVPLANEMDPGETMVYDGEIQISMEALAKGFLTVSVLYSSDGVEYLSQAMCYLTKLEDKVEASLYCVVPDRALKPEETVPVRLVFVNTGYTDINNGRLYIRENTLLADGFILAAKESLAYETDVQVNELESLQARVECESAISGTTYTFSLTRPDYVLSSENIVLSVAGTAEIENGTDPKLSLSIENKGNVYYRMLEIHSNLGTVIAQMPEALKPDDFVTVPMTITASMYDSADIEITLRAIKDDGSVSYFVAKPFRLNVTERKSDPINVKSETVIDASVQENEKTKLANSIFYTLINMPKLAEYVLAASVILSCAAIAALIRRAGKKKNKQNRERKLNV